MRPRKTRSPNLCDHCQRRIRTNSRPRESFGSDHADFSSSSGDNLIDERQRKVDKKPKNVPVPSYSETPDTEDMSSIEAIRPPVIQKSYKHHNQTSSKNPMPTTDSNSNKTKPRSNDAPIRCRSFSKSMEKNSSYTRRLAKHISNDREHRAEKSVEVAMLVNSDNSDLPHCELTKLVEKTARRLRCGDLKDYGESPEVAREHSPVKPTAAAAAAPPPPARNGNNSHCGRRFPPKQHPRLRGSKTRTTKHDSASGNNDAAALHAASPVTLPSPPPEPTLAGQCSAAASLSKTITSGVFRSFYLSESSCIEKVINDDTDRRLSAACDRYQCDIEVFTKTLYKGVLQNLVVIRAASESNIRRCVAALNHRMNWSLSY